MSICSFSIKHPVTTIVSMLLILLFGVLNFLDISVREYPDIDFPTVSISTTYTGAAANIIETKVSQVIEDAVSGIDGIDTIKSVSKDGQSKVQIEFSTEKDIDAAVNDVRDKVSRCANKLPEDADSPIIAKFDSDAMPIIMLSLSSENMDSMELTDYAQRYITDRFSTVEGVADVSVMGAKEKSMRIWLDKTSMAARHITVSDIETALRSENVEYPSGRIESTEREFSVTIKRQYNTVKDFKNLVVKKNQNGDFIRLKDIAKIEVAPKNQRNSFLFNGKPTVSIGISKQSKANTVKIAEKVKIITAELNRELPNGMKLSVLRDESKFISDSIHEVYWTLFITAILVLGIIFLFLGNLKASIIPFVTVPISLIGAFVFINLFGYSINMLTLLAMVLVIGMVVDDAIVMLENIYRRMDEGEEVSEASMKGSEQVIFAVISTSAVLLSVFLPICMLGGKLGKLFSEFAVAVSSAIFFSTVTALTLTPMMCSKMLRKEDKLNNRITKFMDYWLEKISSKYMRILHDSFENKRKYILLFLGICGLSGITIFTLHSEFEPREDRNELIIKTKALEGTGFNAICRYMEKVDVALKKDKPNKILKAMSVIPGFGNQNGAVNSGQIVIELIDKEFRKSSEIVAADYRKLLNYIVGLKTDVILPMGIGSKNSSAIQFIIAGNEYEELQKWRDIILEKSKTFSGITDMDDDYQETTPQLIVNINKDRAAELNVSVEEIGSTLETMLGSKNVTTYIDGGREHDVILQLNNNDRKSISDIENIYVRNKNGTLISLDNVISISEIGAPDKLLRFNRNRAITITASVSPGFSLDQCLNYLNKIVKENLPEYAKIFYSGQSKDLKESSGSLWFVFSLAVLVSFLIMASQFESFISPLIVMMSIPLGALGAVLALKLLGQNLNIYNEIGLLILIGLSTKQGILIVEFANQLLGEKNIVDAVLEASKIRLRPILMTCISTIVGSIPLLLSSGASSASRQSIGIVEFFGCIGGMVFICIFIPLWYVIFLSMKKKVV